MESPPFPEFQSTCSRTPPGESNTRRFVAGKTLTGIAFQAQLFDLENIQHRSVKSRQWEREVVRRRGSSRSFVITFPRLAIQWRQSKPLIDVGLAVRSGQRSPNAAPSRVHDTGKSGCVFSGLCPSVGIAGCGREGEAGGRRRHCLVPSSAALSLRTFLAVFLRHGHVGLDHQLWDAPPSPASRMRSPL